MFDLLFQYMLLGSVAGVIAGLLGVGGGLAIVPALVIFFQRQGIPEEILMHLALGTSLSTIIVTSISSILSHHRHKIVLWDTYKKMLPGIIAGTFLGTVIVDYLPTGTLRTFFGVFEIAVALNMIFGFKPSPRFSDPSPKTLVTSGFGVGVISAVLGIGGGSIAMPLFLFFGKRVLTAVGTASACGLPIAFFGSIGYIIMGWEKVTLPYSVGFVYLPALIGIISASALCAPLGAKLAHSLPVGVLKKIFAGLLFILGAKMLLL